jgi:signal transduction histidine kinase
MKRPRIRFSLRGQVSLAMFVLVLVSFAATGLVSFWHFSEERKEYHRDRLVRKEGAIEAHIAHELERRIPHGIQADSLPRILSDELCHIAAIHRMDLGLYSLEGEMVISSNPTLLYDSILPLRLSPELMATRSSKEWVSWPIDSGEVMAQVTEVTNSVGEPMAIMVLPYQNFEQIPPQDRKFYAALAVLHLLLFMGAAYLSFWLSRNIMRGFDAISDALRVPMKDGTHARIVWDRNDEMGALISEYNRMVDQLAEQNKRQAQWEREQAWKEMARQVAHEVKNPLTPMRLMVQMHAAQAADQTPESIQDFANGMLTQIDAMAQVASDFGQFAAFADRRKSEVDVVEFLNQIRLSFPTIERVYPLDAPWKVKADKAQLVRIFNNLLNNALESIPEGRPPHVALGARETDSAVEIWVQDNGIGIESERMADVFDPHFTTKSSGTGLGLAIVKGLVDAMGGRIWMESKWGVGTTATVWLPTAHSSGISR